MKKRLVALIMVLASTVSLTTSGFAANVNCKSDQFTSATEYAYNTDTETNVNSARVKFPWKAAFKVIKWVLVKVNNESFTRIPTIIDEGGNWVASSSGDVKFGNGKDDVRRMKFTTKIDYSNNKLDVFAQTDMTGWLSKITIFIEDSSGEEEVGGQVTHNQHIYTSSNLPTDTYNTYYVYSGSNKWDCWIYRYDFRTRASGTGSDMIGDMVYNPKNQKSYVIPSDNFGASELKKTTRTSSTLTAQDLFDEFWDEELKCSVNQLKHYNIGDDVVVKDVVYEVAYDSDKDVTTLQFGNTSEGSCEWPFAGDLRERIKVGDELTFKFKIVEEYATEDYTFETLNYFLDSYDLLDNDSAADIDNYLLVSE